MNMPSPREGEPLMLPACVLPTTGERVSNSEYRNRLDIIQSAIYWSLNANDRRFGGDDGIEGLLVFGSYAKSFPIKEGKVLVHRGAIPHFTESDLDIAALNGGRKVDWLTELNGEDIALTSRLDIYHGSSDERLENIRYPETRLSYVLQSHLWDQSFPGYVSLCEEFDINDPEEANLYAFSNGPDSLVNGFGLLFVPPKSPFREKILDLFRKAKLDVVLDPATDALVL